FQFAGGDIAFNGGTNPSLNLELTNSGPDIEAILRVGGHAKQPKLTFDSRPSRPQEEVLSQVLFGKSASSISRFETLQLARAVRELATFGEEETGFNPMGFMRESLGLDVLRMGGGDDDLERRTSNLSGGLGRDLSGSSPSSDPEAEDSAIAVEAGKYLSDNVYVGVEHGADGAAIRMEVELRPNLSLEGRSSAESSRVGLGWKKDY
ncbi:MAG: translocation/assembly module TamB, partial [Candidatus Adiutrix sp.]|nr:translocation/assembly module TamB [Candidatus Adiutrix sp.]